MALVSKFGKHVTPGGQQLTWGAAALTNGAITGMLVANGISGADANMFLDVYGVAITSSDTVQKVTLSDGVNTVSWQVGASPVADNCATPYRFRKGQPLMVSAGAVTSGKEIDVCVRGVLSRT